jgi:acetolactate synthase-1/2/3 large subunit
MILEKLQSAKKPAILFGNGVRYKGVHEDIEKFANVTTAALLTTWTGLDLVDSINPFFCGRPGTIASSWCANYVQQECDFLLILGARLDLAQVGFQPENFAPKAEVMRIDIDVSEFFRVDIQNRVKNFHSNAILVFKNLVSEILEKSISVKFDTEQWWKEIEEFRLLPSAGDYTGKENVISTYQVVEELSKLNFTNVVLGSAGTCIEMVLQSWRPSKGQRFLNSGGLGSMGFGLAGALGVSVKTAKPVLCIESDGSLAMNIQDFETIKSLGKDIKIVILDSQGYKSIELSQKRQDQLKHGTDSATGLHLPDIYSWAKVAGLRASKICKPYELREALEWLMSDETPAVLVVQVSSDEEATPRLISKPDLNGILKTADFKNLWPNP